jgi:hypothetical protein
MKQRVLWVIGAAAAAAVIEAAGAAAPSSGMSLTPVPNANTKSTGYAPPNVLSPELQEIAVAQGSTRVENPDPATISYYGYDNDKVNSDGQPVMVSGTAGAEAAKTEPDKNTYLVFRKGLRGADPNYEYGTHFLFQGHEGAASGFPGSITRINLDADAAHRVTVLAAKDSTGANISTIDGSTWDPWAKRLLFTTESTGKPTYAATPDFPSTVTDVSGALGRGGYEGIQDDSAGDIWIVEDVGGAFKAGTTAKRPNSFIYRYVPKHPGDLANGKLQALQVLNDAGQPITFESQAALHAPDQVALHTYGKTFKTQWVTVHDTATDGTAPFNANDAAKAAHATPFKRPENGLFRPGSNFRQFFFSETGDTDATSPENDDAGGWGGIMKLTQSSPTASTGTLTMFFKSDETTSSFDNCAWLSRDQITFVQDQGDLLHGQANALDSAFVFDAGADYSDASNKPVRWLAEGRDPSATLDSSLGGEENEITGSHVSDGDTSVDGILGAKIPDLSDSSWRWFWTQQHGDNTTWEVTVSSAGHDHGQGQGNDDQGDN